MRTGAGASRTQSSRPRTGGRTLAYTSGNIGPTSTGPHLDVKRVDGGRFEPNALDNYVIVDDPEFGQKCLLERYGHGLVVLAIVGMNTLLEVLTVLTTVYIAEPEFM